MNQPGFHMVRVTSEFGGPCSVVKIMAGQPTCTPSIPSPEIRPY